MRSFIEACTLFQAMCRWYIFLYKIWILFLFLRSVVSYFHSLQTIKIFGMLLFKEAEKLLNLTSTALWYSWTKTGWVRNAEITNPRKDCSVARSMVRVVLLLDLPETHKKKKDINIHVKLAESWETKIKNVRYQSCTNGGIKVIH